MQWLSFYTAPDMDIWQGRTDDSKDAYLFQIIQSLDLRKIDDKAKGFALLGFCCDEGVRRNLGRVGAKEGPQAIRTQLAKIAAHGSYALFDAGNIHCDDENLEAAQSALAEAIALLLQHDFFPIVLGGGHETAWGHYQGIAKQYADISIINFDAHFDLRTSTQSTSGTPFKQIAAATKHFDYTVLGIAPFSNTETLFNTAQQLDVTYVLAEAFHSGEDPQSIIKAVIDRAKAIYLTICLDVFSACYAPGVSATQANGLSPNDVIPAIKTLAASGKVVSMDIVELAPKYDVDQRTAKLAALLVAEFLRFSDGIVP